ncbi:uncharacterized protein LOC128221045 isoform X1 [Mya arenaria]|uniref:uncharacterized protein LOC128221045 isoform X1 n=1 Tax=Mya arenaria TaxID=6604 RepID=UPI0022E7BFB0|nr:uncharacterized protein LOC128221045 isoform X1 [Mya arenaria]XP_052785419.1 uncharacterized protein LOC128221045 isoform X1 [Mya arenaria]XP_052785420.1 uncharacterized protein LOC128221045 isoform X1 [Mya arenaria]
MFLPETKEDDQFRDEGIYKEIEFLFHLTLRDSCDLCDLTDMIRDQLINIIYQQDESACAYSTMQSVLSNSKCVIIADGLDEWTHPNETKCRCSEEDKVLPYLAPTIDATVMITSRPWRMSQQRVKDTNIDTYLEIERTADIKLLIQKILNILNETVEEKRTLLDLIKFVDRMDVTRLLFIPIIAMLLVYLWFEGMHESFSVCDIYGYTIEMMFGRKALPVPLVSQKNVLFPRCFQYTENVHKYYSIVMEIAQLAFTTLFSSDRTSSLVFKKVDILPPVNLMFLLKSGILQETKAASLIRKTSNYSFIHKSVQEFLAAVYISYHPEEFYRVLTSFYEKNGDLLDISQVFMFMCGLNIELANEMSAIMSNSIRNDYEFLTNIIGNHIQNLMVSGYKEAKASEQVGIQLSLFDYCYTTESDTIDALLSMNKSRVRYITTKYSCISQEKLQEAFNCSTDTLFFVMIDQQTGKYDLSACNRLQHLSITRSETTDIVVKTKNLLSLDLTFVSKSVEYSILKSFEHGSNNLKILVIEGSTNNALLCQTLPRLTHLIRLKMSGIDLGNNALLLPHFVECAHLEEVTMTARSFRGMVEWLENRTNGVRCVLDGCTVAPKKQYQKIKRYIQTRVNLKSEIQDGLLIMKTVAVETKTNK